MSKFESSTIYEKHKRTNGEVRITTIRKTDKTNINPKVVKKVLDAMIKKENGKKFMVKCLGKYGVYTMKGYNDDISVILDDDDYLSGNFKDVENYDNHITKFSIYMISENKK